MLTLCILIMKERSKFLDYVILYKLDILECTDLYQLNGLYLRIEGKKCEEREAFVTFFFYLTH